MNSFPYSRHQFRSLLYLSSDRIRLASYRHDQMERLRTFFPKGYGKPRVDRRRVLISIIFVNRNGMHWRDAP